MKPSVFIASAIAIVALAGSASNKAGAATNQQAKFAKIQQPNSVDWIRIVHPTAAGGFVMGNPNAKVRLVEFGSMTCPHCRAFDEESVSDLLGYVKTGKVSWEFRNYVRDAFDITSALIARCDGTRSFFPLTRALYKDQPSWEAKVAATPDDQLKSAQDLPPSKQFVRLANISGLQQWAAAHGIPAARTNACLADEKSVEQLVQMASNATRQFPDFEGTPAFAINGRMLKGTATWDMLEPQLKSAIARRN